MCLRTFAGTDIDIVLSVAQAQDCYAIRSMVPVGSGVFSVFLTKFNLHKRVVCDMKTDGGGWTVCISDF